MTDLIPIGKQYVSGATGFYSMPAEAYHSAPGVSQTMLSKIARSPAHLQAWLKEERKSTPAQVFGTLCHLALFEPEALGDGKSHWVKPLGLKLSTKEGSAWAEARRNGLPFIDREDWEALKGICDSAHSHMVGAGLLGARGVAEVSAFEIRTIELGGLRDYHILTLKARLDRIVQANDGSLYIVDAKTCEDASPEGFRREMWKWGYMRQAAFYQDVCRSLGLDVRDFIWLAVEKEPPFAVAVYRLGQGLDGEPDDIGEGRAMYRRELEVYARCVRENHWPGYSSEIQRIELRRGK